MIALRYEMSSGALWTCGLNKFNFLNNLKYCYQSLTPQLQSVIHYAHLSHIPHGPSLGHQNLQSIL